MFWAATGVVAGEQLGWAAVQWGLAAGLLHNDVWQDQSADGRTGAWL